MAIKPRGTPRPAPIAVLRFDEESLLIGAVANGIGVLDDACVEDDVAEVFDMVDEEDEVVLLVIELDAAAVPPKGITVTVVYAAMRLEEKQRLSLL
jgi:hypothetical protein